MLKRLLYFVPALIFCQPVQAQGLMEYGGLMAMPRGLPTGAANALTRPYNMVPQLLPQGSSQGSAVNTVPSAIQSTMPDGTVVIDQKKVKAISEKANKLYATAKEHFGANPSKEDLKEAEKDLRESITLRNSVWGYQDPQIPGMLNMLGKIYVRQEQLPSAESCFKNALVYINHRTGPGSIERVGTLVNLASLYEKQGNWKEALPHIQQLSLIKDRQNGENSVDAINARLDWAQLAARMDRGDTQELFERCMKSMDRLDETKDGSAIPALTKRMAETYPAYLRKKGKEEEAKLTEEKLGVKSSEAESPVAPGSTVQNSAAPPVNKSTN